MLTPEVFGTRRMRMAARVYAGLTFAVLAGAVFWYFVRESAEKTPNSRPSAIPVTFGQSKNEDVPLFATGLGTVQAMMYVAVRSRVDGQITGVFFTEGQDVKKGDPLFQIDPRPFQVALELAQANKRRDEAQLGAAKLVLDRYAKLLASATQTQEVYDNQKATVGQLEAATQADQAQIEAAQLNLDYAQIRSPIDGRTSARLVDPGNLVQASQNTALVTVAQIEPIFVSFSIPQDLLSETLHNDARRKLTVIAYAADDKTELAEGTLTLIDNQIDVPTGTIHLKAEFANKDRRLWPGEFVNARLILAMRHNAVTVPAQAVMQGPDGAYVYRLKPDDTVERQSVEIASTQDGLAVIQNGLSAGENIVVDGQYRLTDGVKVAASGSQQTATTGAGATPP
jgi:membrane fusion protein, multidrug efflux system